jgi:DNA-binding CsgD family transcriptional regulator
MGLLDAPDPSEDDAGRRLRDDLWRLIVDRVFAESNFSGRSKAIFTRNVAGESLTDLAREFGMERNAAYQLKNRIMKKLTDKARALERESGDIIDMICALEREQGEKDNGE